MTSAKKSKSKREKSNPVQNQFVSIILLGENYGYRMKSCGPISLIKVGNKTLLEHQVEAISSSFSNYEIVLCCGFEAEKVISFVQFKLKHTPIRVVENQTYSITNCCESTRLSLNNISNDRVLVCNGELMLNQNQLKSIDLTSSSVLSQDYSGGNMEMGIIQNDRRLESINLGIKGEFWSEMLYLSSKRSISSLKTHLASTEFKTKFLFEAINAMCKKTLLKVENSKHHTFKINNAKSLQRILNENIS